MSDRDAPTGLASTAQRIAAMQRIVGREHGDGLTDEQVATEFFALAALEGVAHNPAYPPGERLDAALQVIAGRRDRVAGALRQAHPRAAGLPVVTELAAAAGLDVDDIWADDELGPGDRVAPQGVVVSTADGQTHPVEVTYAGILAGISRWAIANPPRSAITGVSVDQLPPNASIVRVVLAGGR